MADQDLGRQERTGENISIKNQNGSHIGIDNIFKNTYIPSDIKFNFPADSTSQREVAQNTGFLPFVWYNVYQISHYDIKYFLLSHDGIIPIIKIIFRDSLNIMKDKGMPLDDTKIKIFLNPRNSKLKPILLQFKISTFSINGSIFTIGGVLDIDGLYTKKFKSYKNLTSSGVLQEISKEMGLGFNTNLDDTSDQMTWINTGDRTYEFVTDIIDTSYKSDESFILGYIDYYYHFNYVDIEKELNRNVKDELGVSSFGLEEAAQVKDKDKLASLFLTNDATHKTSNTFISSYKIINNSTIVSLNEGYLTRVQFYDISKELLVFDVDSITSTGDKIILKGSPQNEGFFKENVNLMYAGKMDSDNTHKNFNYSNVQNDRNISELRKIGMNIILGTPNYNLYRFQKIQVLITNQTPTPSQSGINHRLSGEWMIASIKFEYEKSIFMQKISLVKRDLNLSPEESKQEENQNKQENTNIDSSNPIDSTTINPDNLNNTDVSNTPVDTKKLSLLEKLNGQVPKNVLDQLSIVIDKFNIDTPLRLSHFLANCYHESGGFKSVVENLNYSSKRLLQIFKSYFKTEAEAELYAGNPQKIASRVYGSRIGNGDESTLDGWKYRGRGYIQLTGRSNYFNFDKFVEDDIILNPDLVSTKYPLLSAAFFWNSVKLNSISDRGSDLDTITAVRRKINGGTNGLNDVNKYFNKYYNILKD